MACERPNLMRFNTAFGTTKFIGPQSQELDAEALSLDFFDNYFQTIPCGKCELCRIEQRYCKALRIMLEAESWPESTYFITLTYDDQHVGDGEHRHEEWAQFIKNFRQKFCQAKYCNIRDRGTLRHGREYSKTFKKIKQVMCAEYGDTFGRKHYHGIIFNHSFQDVVFTGFYSEKGNPIYTSQSLREVWNKGNVQLEKVTFDLALYVGSYVTDAIDDPSNKFGFKQKQYGRFGRGIGLSWLKKYWRDILVAGKVMLLKNGEMVSYPIPRMFIRWMEDICPDALNQFRLQNSLRRFEEQIMSLKKGDGSLRRAKAKASIFKSTSAKRRKDSGDVRSI